MSEKITVLLIEDNPGDARMVRESLTGPSATAPFFQMEWRDRLASGLERLRFGGIDVVLLDLGLPYSQIRRSGMVKTMPHCAVSNPFQAMAATMSIRHTPGFGIAACSS
jgi:CheY-like chemotaxis protein